MTPPPEQIAAGLSEAQRDAERCVYCGGYGDVYVHADDCVNDLCALAGGIDDCLGRVDACPACHLLEKDRDDG